MSTSGDTEKKLIDSIRKTKKAAAKKVSAKTSDSASPRKKAVSRRKGGNAGSDATGYQAARRVWPD